MPPSPRSSVPSHPQYVTVESPFALNCRWRRVRYHYFHAILISPPRSSISISIKSALAAEAEDSSTAIRVLVSTLP